MSILPVVWNLFSFKGRIGRQELMFTVLGASVLFGLFTAFEALLRVTGLASVRFFGGLNYLFMMGVWVVLMWTMLCAFAKRVQDIGVSSWWFAGCFLGLVVLSKWLGFAVWLEATLLILLFVFVFAFPGRKKTTRFGHPQHLPFRSELPAPDEQGRNPLIAYLIRAFSFKGRAGVVESIGFMFLVPALLMPCSLLVARWGIVWLLGCLVLFWIGLAALSRRLHQCGLRGSWCWVWPALGILTGLIVESGNVAVRLIAGLTIDCQWFYIPLMVVTLFLRTRPSAALYGASPAKRSFFGVNITLAFCLLFAVWAIWSPLRKPRPQGQPAAQKTSAATAPSCGVDCTPQNYADRYEEVYQKNNQVYKKNIYFKSLLDGSHLVWEYDGAGVVRTENQVDARGTVYLTRRFGANGQLVSFQSPQNQLSAGFGPADQVTVYIVKPDGQPLRMTLSQTTRTQGGLMAPALQIVQQVRALQNPNSPGK